MVEYFVKQLRGLLIIGIQEKVFKDAVKEFVLEIKELTYKFIWIQRCEEVSMIKASRKIWKGGGK